VPHFEIRFQVTNFAQTPPVLQHMLTRALRKATRKMVQPGKADRDSRMYVRRKDGLTLAAIGREFHVSVETVHRVVKKMKLKTWWHEIDEKTQRARVSRLTNLAREDRKPR
jgi:hypothetical protein